MKETFQRVEAKIDALFLKHDNLMRDYIEFKTRTDTLLTDMLKRKTATTTFVISLLSGSAVAVVAMLTRFIK